MQAFTFRFMQILCSYSFIIIKVLGVCYYILGVWQDIIRIVFVIY